MDFWVDDSAWKTCNASIRDNWNYLKKVAGGGMHVASDDFNNKSYQRYPIPDIRIRQSLSRDDWQLMMKILTEMDVSGLELLEVKLPTDISVPGLEEVYGADLLSSVLRTGRFSTLTTLKIRCGRGFGKICLGEVDSESLAAILRSGQFTKLDVLSLPRCDASAILAALKDGHITQLRSFSVISNRKGLDSLSQNKLCLNLDAVLKSGCFKNLQHLDLSEGVLDGLDAWEAFMKGVNSGMMPNVTSLSLSNNALNLVNLADLVPWLLLNSFENLILNSCWINSHQLCGMANTIMIGNEAVLTLKRLDLRDNLLTNRAVGALVDLGNSDKLPCLDFLDLSENKGIDWRALPGLAETIEEALLVLKTLKYPADDGTTAEASRPVNGQAFLKNEAQIRSRRINWNHKSDFTFRTKANKYKSWTVRLIALKQKQKQLKNVLSFICEKMFCLHLCRSRKESVSVDFPAAGPFFTWEKHPYQEQ